MGGTKALPNTKSRTPELFSSIRRLIDLRGEAGPWKAGLLKSCPSSRRVEVGQERG